MGTRERRNGERADAPTVQKGIHVPAGIHETDAGPEKYAGLLQIHQLVVPHWPGTLPGGLSTLQELALAMIKSVSIGYEKPVLEVKDIVSLAKR